MPLPSLSGIIQSLSAGIKTVFKSVAALAAKLWANVRVVIFSVEDTLFERVAPEKRRLVYYGAAGVFAAMMVVIIMGLVMFHPESGKARYAAAELGVPRSALIPPDELFLPDEPDFVPGVMLGREQREEWASADAAPLWQDPLKNGEQEWRNLIEKTVDEIMESVP